MATASATVRISARTPLDGVRVDTRGCEIKDEIRLPSVQFETNSDRLRSGAESSLNDAVITLRRYPSCALKWKGTPTAMVPRTTTRVCRTGELKQYATIS